MRCYVLIVAVVLACVATVSRAAADVQAPPRFHVDASDASPLQLVNPEETTRAKTSAGTVLNAATGADPYVKSACKFRFARPLEKIPSDFTLEIEFVDIGAGVIQPAVLLDDAFNGRWAAPVRAVSFTRLNTNQTRRAFFQFVQPPVTTLTSRHPHLTVSGLQGLRAIRMHDAVSEDEWSRAEASVPVHVTPMVSLRRPMFITCTVGIPDTGYPPSRDAALNNIREYAPLAKVLGFTSIECFVRWDLIEPRPGEFNFAHYDAIVETIRRYDMKWYPNLVITSAFALPQWYYESREYHGMRCLEHGDVNQVPSIWNPANEAHVDRVLKAFADHYAPTGVLEAVRLGPSGNFGEAQFPAGAGGALGYRGEPMHAHIGWWAGDAFARDSFRAFLRGRYTTIAALAEAWGEPAAGFDDLAPRLPETYRTHRARLDMTEWYTESMSRWCGFWAGAARRALPDVPIYQSSGGWGYREAGTDFSAQAKSMRDIAGGIRLTNETDSFEQNVYAIRLAATAARRYGISLGYEPAGYHSARGVAARFFTTAATNGDNLYTRHSVLFADPYAVQKWLDGYHLLDERAEPLVDVAIYYPETMNQLDDGAFRHLYAWGFNPRAAEVRRRVDADFLDERLIRDGFLDRYRVLIFCWGNVIERDVQRRIDEWIRNGGVAIYPSYPRGPQRTVEGDDSVFLAWERGDTGNGAFHRFPGDMEPIQLYGDFVESLLLNTTTLHPWTRRAVATERPPHTHIAVLENGRVLALNYSDAPADITLPDQESQQLQPYTARVIGTFDTR